MGSPLPGLSLLGCQGSFYVCDQAGWVRSKREPPSAPLPGGPEGQRLLQAHGCEVWEEHDPGLLAYLPIRVTGLCLEGHGLHQLTERAGEATMETAPKQTAGHWPLPLPTTHVSARPRWPGSPGLPRCGLTVTTVTTTNRRSWAATSKPQQACQPQLAGPLAQAGTVPGTCMSSALSSFPAAQSVQPLTYGTRQ